MNSLKEQLRLWLKARRMALLPNDVENIRFRLPSELDRLAELATKNIRVNCVAPGATYPTGLSENWSMELRNNIAKSIPMKRLGKPEEIADAVVFLLSDDASYITGQTLDVNGGQWMN